MKLTYSKSALKCNSFDVTIDIKIPFRVLVTIELGCSLLQFVTVNCCIVFLIFVTTETIVSNKHYKFFKQIFPRQWNSMNWIPLSWVNFFIVSKLCLIFKGSVVLVAIIYVVRQYPFQSQVDCPRKSLTNKKSAVYYQV